MATVFPSKKKAEPEYEYCSPMFGCKPRETRFEKAMNWLGLDGIFATMVALGWLSSRRWRVPARLDLVKCSGCNTEVPKDMTCVSWPGGAKK